MRVVLVSVLMMATVPLAGCGRISDAWGNLWGSIPSEPLPYRAKLSKGEAPRDFLVTVNAGGVGVDAVRETVRFEATGYCLKNFGGSGAEWLINPDTGDWSFAREGTNMVFRGRCTQR